MTAPEPSAASLARRVDKIVAITDPETVEPTAAALLAPSEYVQIHVAPRWLPLRVCKWLARHNLTRSAWGFVMEDSPMTTTCCGRPVPEAGHDHLPCCEEHGCCDGQPHDA